MISLTENCQVDTQVKEENDRYVAGCSQFVLILLTLVCMIPQILTWLSVFGDSVDAELARRSKYQ
jgi:hypothetical protein